MRIVVVAAVVAVALAGCSGSLRERNTGVGALVGAGTGAVIGAATTGTPQGTAAGAATMIRLLEGDHLNDQLAGLRWLRAQNFVDAKRIAVGGNSFGGIV